MGSRQPELPRVRRLTLSRLAFRFFTGRPLDGYRRTDAIFLKRGRHSMDPSGWASPWSYLAGWERLVVRLVGLYVFVWGLLLLVAWALRRVAGGYAPDWAERWTPGHVLMVHLLWTVVLGLVPGLIWGVRYWGLSTRVPDLAVERVQTFPFVKVSLDGWVPVEIPGRRTWDRQYVRPVAAAAQSVLGTTYHPKEARKWVQVPRTFRNVDGSPVVIRLPQSFTGDVGTQKRLVSAVSNRLGLRDPSVTWDLEGDHPRVLLAAPPLPPTRVSFADVRAALEAAEEFQVVLGLAARREVLTAHLVGDSPHVGVSAGSGAGKSELIKIMVMLALRWGWGVVILDWKEVSQSWADGLPGVLYARDIEDIHDVCVALGEEVDTRKRLFRQDRDMPGKAKALVVAEEMNVTAPLLTEWWAAYRGSLEPEERRVTPVRSPAITGLHKVVSAGRQFGLFEVLIAQRFSNRVTNGNVDLRESFGTRLLARATVQTWKMLAPHIKPIPKMGQEPGRWCAVIGQDAIVFQAPLITDEEAREFALGGQENPSNPLTSTHRPAMPSQDEVDHELGESLGDRPALPNQRAGVLDGELVEEMEAPVLRKLSDLHEGLSHLGVTLDVLRHAAKDPESGFPPAQGGSPNRGYKYDAKAVLEWARKRNASRVAKGEVKK